jgi:hypothetical protein
MFLRFNLFLILSFYSFCYFTAFIIFLPPDFKRFVFLYFHDVFDEFVALKFNEVLVTHISFQCAVSDGFGKLGFHFGYIGLLYPSGHEHILV